jgi:hypothetical protein
MNDPEKNVLKNKILRPKKGHAKMSAWKNNLTI